MRLVKRTSTDGAQTNKRVSPQDRISTEGAQMNKRVSPQRDVSQNTITHQLHIHSEVLGEEVAELPQFQQLDGDANALCTHQVRSRHRTPLSSETAFTEFSGSPVIKYLETVQ